MATVLKGKRAGQEVDIVQFANDWVTVDCDDGQRVIMNPTMLKWTASEIDRLLKDQHIGMFWAYWEMNSDLTFKKRGRKR